MYATSAKRLNLTVSHSLSRSHNQTRSVRQSHCYWQLGSKQTRKQIYKLQKRLMTRTVQPPPGCSHRYWDYITYSVSPKKILPQKFSDIFTKRFGIFSPNFTCPLNVPIYAGLQIFIQLSATLTKLCHIKRDHHNELKMSTINRNACWMVALNIA